MWNSAKELLKEKFIVLNVYIRKGQRSQITNFFLKKLEKKDKMHPKQALEKRVRN